MNIENDNVLNFLYEEEFSKIPLPFRFGRKRAKIVIGILIASFIAMMISLALMFDTREWVPMGRYGYNMLNPVYIVMVILFGALTCLIAGWLGLSLYMEKRAFRKASLLANRIYLSERHEAEIKWQNWKESNRYE